MPGPAALDKKQGQRNATLEQPGSAPASREPQKPAAFDTGAPAYPPMVQGYPAQPGGYAQQQLGYAQQPQQPGYAAQPPPHHQGYTPGHNVPYNSVQAAHCYSSCTECFNLQWALFIAGWFCFFPSLLAVFLPLFQRGRLQRDPSYRGGWICNLVLCVLWIFAGILTSILVNNAQRSGRYSGGQASYYYG
ncbi:hypothetical protein WJX81_003259 [Elliptochloris bilobata]|uniref:DUF4190 domain-containing protein n=1 Tax=Elliptochloris bilobata TaxID=381761 RepID=A0AAW1QJN3_9CHLO